MGETKMTVEYKMFSCFYLNDGAMPADKNIKELFPSMKIVYTKG